MDKAVKLAKKNTIRNENGEVVFTKDEIDDMKDTFDEMIKAGEAFKKVLGISDDEIYDLLQRNKQ